MREYKHFRSQLIQIVIINIIGYIIAFLYKIMNNEVHE